MNSECVIADSIPEICRHLSPPSLFDLPRLASSTSVAQVTSSCLLFTACRSTFPAFSEKPRLFLGQNVQIRADKGSITWPIVRPCRPVTRGMMQSVGLITRADVRPKACPLSSTSLIDVAKTRTADATLDIFTTRRNSIMHYASLRPLTTAYYRILNQVLVRNDTQHLWNVEQWANCSITKHYYTGKWHLSHYRRPRKMFGPEHTNTHSENSTNT